ncbi:MAG: SMP-30/gluconolactonase/LRE family protein [Pseudomonadota bacterium]
MNSVFDDRRCWLGEGPLWHPGRNQFFWFDIRSNLLLSRDSNGPQTWDFGENVSAAGWLSDTELLVASETGLLRFDIETRRRESVLPLEADDPTTRSNDGRADPWGGFWIGTMGKAGEPGPGRIYRYYRGELRTLYDRIKIPNAICFTPDRRYAYFTDSATYVVQRVLLNSEDGWPAEDPVPWLDLRAERLLPDGAVVDTSGNVWIAHWGASRVTCYGPDARPIQSIGFPALNTSCPAFGGPEMSTLFCTTATQYLPKDRETEDEQGRTYHAPTDAVGQPEHKVIL